MFPDKLFNLRYQNELSFDFLAGVLLILALARSGKYFLIGQNMIVIGWKVGKEGSDVINHHHGEGQEKADIV